MAWKNCHSHVNSHAKIQSEVLWLQEPSFSLFIHATFSFIWLCMLVSIQTEKAMTPHSSTLAWKIPWAEEPGGLQSMRSLRVEVYEAKTSLSLFTFMHWRRKWQPTPVFLPGESQDGGAWWAAVSGVAQSRTRPKWLSSSAVLWQCSGASTAGSTNSISGQRTKISQPAWCSQKIKIFNEKIYR